MLINNPSTSGGFANAVEKVFAGYGDGGNCASVLRSGYSQLMAELQKDPSSPLLHKMFQLCDALGPENVDNFLLYTLVSASFVCQFNFPFPFRYSVPHPVNYSCTNVLLPLQNDPLSALAAFVNFGLHFMGMPCLDTTLYPPGLMNGALGRAWDYQRCTQIVMVYASSGNSIFPPMPFDKAAYREDCLGRFPDLNSSFPSFNYITEAFSGHNASDVDRVLYTNGFFDPVSSQSPQNGSVLWANMAHTEDMLYPLAQWAPFPNPSVEVLREQVLSILLAWLKQWC